MPEHRGDIVFLYQVQTGAASQSYGIQVAKLAGVPKTVLDVARAQLRGFEQNAVFSKAAVSGQSDLFIADDADHRDTLADEEDIARQIAETLINELKRIDVDELSPRQALDVLDRLKQFADEEFSSE